MNLKLYHFDSIHIGTAKPKPTCSTLSNRAGAPERCGEAACPKASSRKQQPSQNGPAKPVRWKSKLQDGERRPRLARRSRQPGKTNCRTERTAPRWPGEAGSATATHCVQKCTAGNTGPGKVPARRNAPTVPHHGLPTCCWPSMVSVWCGEAALRAKRAKNPAPGK